MTKTEIKFQLDYIFQLIESSNENDSAPLPEYLPCGILFANYTEKR